MRDGQYVNGEKDGPWVSYFANGRKMSEGSYRAGRKNGLWVQYWPSGKPKSRATFVDGKYTGLYECWFENGNRQWEGYYNPIRGNSADGTKEGVWLAHDKETGEVYRVITYHRGGRTKPDENAPFESVPAIGPPPRDD